MNKIIRRHVQQQVAKTHNRHNTRVQRVHNLQIDSHAVSY